MEFEMLLCYDLIWTISDHFTYTGCGDPFETRPVDQTLPMVPNTEDKSLQAGRAATDAQCMEIGCAGIYVGGKFFLIRKNCKLLDLYIAIIATQLF